MNFIKAAVKNSYFTLLIYLLILTFIAIFFANASHVFFSTLDPKKSEFDKWEKALQVAISVTGFLSLLVSIKIWQDTDKRQVNQAALSLFEKFRDQNFRELRRRAWRIRNKWYLEEGYKEKIKTYVETEDNFYVEYDDNFYMNEFADIRALFEFYAMLTNYNGSEEIIKSCRYFYYGWWRPFLYEIADINDYFYNVTINFKEKYPKQYQNYNDNMSYRRTLEKLDIMLGFDSISESDKIHDFN